MTSEKETLGNDTGERGRVRKDQGLEHLEWKNTAV